MKRSYLLAKMLTGPLAIQSCPEFCLRRETAARLGTMALGLISQYQACQGNPGCGALGWGSADRPAVQPLLSGPHDYYYRSYLSNEGPFLLMGSKTL